MLFLRRCGTFVIVRESLLFDLEHFIIELSGSCLMAARIIIILMMDKLNLITSLTTDGGALIGLGRIDKNLKHNS